MDFNKMFSAIKDSGIASGLPGGLAGGVIGGALMTKKGRKVAGSALKVGGLAAVGGLAYAAYKNYQKQNTQAQAVSGSEQSVNPASFQGNAAQAAAQKTVGQSNWDTLTSRDFEQPTQAHNSQALVLIQAMIAAAASDGHVDASERERIFTEVGNHNLSSEEKTTLFDALSSPASVDNIANAVDSPALAAEVYAVSLATINPEATVSKHYLEVLANRLAIPEQMKEHIHRELAA